MEPIAIIGSGCRFPGGVVDAASYWDRLLAGTDAIGEIPGDRWDVDAYYDADPDAPGKMYTRWGGFLSGIDDFDGSLLGISASEAATMDPQQRVLLEVAWEALESAGQVPASLLERPVGVFVGICGSDHAHNRARSLGAESIGPYHGIGTAQSIAAGRISHALGLRGPAVSVDTACSSSLMALHLGCQSLRAGECELVLAAGVNLMLAPEVMIWLCKMRALAPDGRCKTFDARANGFARGEGCGVVVLKRLRDALADGDPIVATVMGSAANQDGKSAGLTAPSPAAQVDVLRQALANAQLGPGQIGYVEAHGTGTSLGDPIEIDALTEVYGDASDESDRCHVGSVKTNLGHLEAAAGMAGLIKAALTVQHGQIPPHLHLQTLNPMIRLEGTRLAIPRQPTPWPGGPAGERHAAVSAFGFSGTNVHVILGRAPDRSATRADARVGGPHVFPFSAASPEALAQLGARYARHFSPGGLGVDRVADSVFTASVRRQHHACRRAIVAADAEQLVRQLEQPAVVPPVAGPPRVAFVFSGQGSQWAGMALALARHEPRFGQILERCAAIIEDEADWSLPDELARPPESSRLDQTAIAQPAIFAVQAALAGLLRHWGIVPALVVGHSVGEIAAAHVAGALDLPQAMRLSLVRGRLMESAAGEGSMLATRLSASQLEARLEEHPELGLDVAAVNGPRSTVVAGPAAAIERLAGELAAAGVEHRALRARYAFHSRSFKPVQSKLRRALESIEPAAAKITMISTLTGREVDTRQLDSTYWSKQLVRPVAFFRAIVEAAERGATEFVEIGPRPVLLPAVQETLESRGHGPAVLPSMLAEGDAARALRETVARLYERGSTPDWSALCGDAGTVAPLPRYPWQPVHHPRAPMRPGPAAPVTAAVATEPSRPRAPHAPAHALPDIVDALVEIMSSLLGVDAKAIDPAADLMTLGADSLVVIDGMQRVRRRFGVSIPLAEVFSGTPSIESLARSLARRLAAPTDPSAAGSAPPSIEPPSPPASAAPSPAVPEDPPVKADDFLRTLDTSQRDHLDQILRRYASRTKGSADRRERAQPHLADVRSAAGFRTSFPAAVRAKWLATRAIAHPVVGTRSEGARFWDVDGNEYVDFAMGFGVHLFGHRPAFLVEALHEQMSRGLHIGPQSEYAGEVAARLCALTSVERAAFCSTGTEAVMTALRLARAATGRSRIAMFAGAYHGHSDGVLPAIPMTRGAPPHTDEAALVLEYGVDEAIEAIEAHADQLAAVIVEPVQGRRPELQPRRFLHALREVTARHGIALIFDEVLVGFRIHPGGAQAWFDVRADIVTYGKIIGGGLPIGVIAGRSRFLDLIDGGSWTHARESAPHTEPIWFAGTFNKNPLTMAAARAVLGQLEQQGPGLQQALNAKTDALAATLHDVFARAEVPIEVVHFGSLFRFALPRALELFYPLLNLRGVYAWEGRTFFLSTAHEDRDLERLVDAATEAAHELREAGWVRATASPAPRARVEVVPPRARLELLCLPFAGGGSRPFASWEHRLPPDVALRPVELPGRSPTTGPAFTEMAPLVEHLCRELLPTLHRPFALFGHSMGALLAFELARALRREGGPTPVHLLVSGEPAPHLPREPISPSALGDDELLARMTEYGMPELAASDPWLRDTVLPRLRADLQVCASFRHTPGPALDCSVSAFGGLDDPLARRAQLRAWAAHGRGRFSLRMFEGDHFYMRHHEQALVEAIVEDLGPCASPDLVPARAHPSLPGGSP